MIWIFGKLKATWNNECLNKKKYSNTKLIFSSDWSNIILLNIEQTRTSFFEHWSRTPYFWLLTIERQTSNTNIFILMLFSVTSTNVSSYGKQLNAVVYYYWGLKWCIRVFWLFRAWNEQDKRPNNLDMINGQSSYVAIIYYKRHNLWNFLKWKFFER